MYSFDQFANWNDGEKKERFVEKDMKDQIENRGNKFILLQTPKTKTQQFPYCDNLSSE